MTNREFDRLLRESLSSVRPEFRDDWDTFVRRVEDAENGSDAAFDDQIRGSLSTLGTDQQPDWDRMQELLDAESNGFDEHVRNTVEKLDVPYNAGTWPVLDARLSREERTRKRLLVAKILEIAAIFIALFTFYNIFPAIQTHFSGSPEPAGHMSVSDTAPFVVPATPDQAGQIMDVVSSEQANADQPSSVSQVLENANANTLFGGGVTASAIHASEVGKEYSSQPDQKQFIAAQFLPARTSMLYGSEPAPISDRTTRGSTPSPHLSAHTELLEASALLALTSERGLGAGVATASLHKKSSKVRFGMMAAADINTLFVPDDFFYSQGQAIRFSEKEIEAGGYTAGISLLFDQPRFLVETGISYSSKNFGPDRKLFIGSSPDQHELDFENITLNVLSVPLFLHLKIDGKGLWRMYVVAGASLHVIADAHYDLIAEYATPASAAPLDPMQLQNQREVQRVREHMLDGAKFNSKAYLTAAGGIGVERFLNSRSSVFAQPMYHYQIPFFGLLDQNGKHLRNTSLLLGTRISF